MLYVIALISGIAVGIAAGGRLSNLTALKIKRTWAILAAFAVQAVFGLLTGRALASSAFWSMAAYGLCYALLIFGFYVNRNYRGFMVIGAGCLLNAAVILFNGGRMPVDMELLEKAGLVRTAGLLATGMSSKHVPAGMGTRLGFLADVVYLPYFPGVLMRVVSIGDLVVAAGLFVLMAEVVKGRKK